MDSLCGSGVFLCFLSSLHEVSTPSVCRSDSYLQAKRKRDVLIRTTEALNRSWNDALATDTKETTASSGGSVMSGVEEPPSVNTLLSDLSTCWNLLCDVETRTKAAR